MRSKKSLLIAVLFILNFVAGAQVKTIYVTSYGAKPSDKSSDQAAFNRIADMINQNKGNMRVIFPKGKYLVGPSYRYNKATPVFPTIGMSDVFGLINCNNVTFEGNGKVEIVFEDSIPFGIYPDNSPAVKRSINIGELFRLTSCTNITIKNISSDGNNQKMNLLDHWGVGNKPYEREHEGLLILSCQSVKVDNCSFNYFGRDGAMILQDPEKMPVKDISFTNCSFNYNGRNGFSWCGGENVRFYKCTFSNNSKGRIETNPGAGLDIEPERDAFCKKGNFTRCEFANNGGYAVTSGYSTASEVVFDSCRIIGNSNYSFHTVSPKFTVSNSFIAGTSLLYCDATIAADGTKLNNCIFTDSIPGQKVYILNYIAGVLGQNVQFSGCTFNSYIAPIAYVDLIGKKIADSSGNTRFKKCSLNAYFKKPTTWGKMAFLGANIIFEDCIFKSSGYADFRLVLSEEWRKIYQRRNTIIN